LQALRAREVTKPKQLSLTMHKGETSLENVRVSDSMVSDTPHRLTPHNIGETFSTQVNTLRIPSKSNFNLKNKEITGVKRESVLQRRSKSKSNLKLPTNNADSSFR
jgi:hypothetical protein